MDTQTPDLNQAADLLEAAVEAAAAGAAVLAKRSLTGMNAVNKSSSGDWVTDFDTAAEAAVREVLARLRPNDVVTGEELDNAVPENPSGIRWSIDPLDGTTNFIRNFPYYGVSVAAADDTGNWLAGVVHAPALGRVYSASLGQGAWLTEGRTRTRLTGPDPERTGKILGTGFAYDDTVRAAELDSLPLLAKGYADVRRFGSAALDLCMVADGTLDAFFQRGLQEYDYAAGALIAAEAGTAVLRPAPGLEGDEKRAAVTAAGSIV